MLSHASFECSLSDISSSLVFTFFVLFFFFFSSRRRHTRSLCDWSSDVCSSDLARHAGHQPDADPVELGDEPFGGNHCDTTLRTSPGLTDSATTARPPFTASATLPAESTYTTSRPGWPSAKVPARLALSPPTSRCSPSPSIALPGAASWTLPKRSTVSTSASRYPSPTTTIGSGSRTNDSGSIAGPASASGTPAARRAATGAKMSRPWKVIDTSGRNHGACV